MKIYNLSLLFCLIFFINAPSSSSIQLQQSQTIHVDSWEPVFLSHSTSLFSVDRNITKCDSIALPDFTCISSKSLNITLDLLLPTKLHYGESELITGNITIHAFKGVTNLTSPLVLDNISTGSFPFSYMLNDTQTHIDISASSSSFSHLFSPPLIDLIELPMERVWSELSVDLPNKVIQQGNTINLTFQMNTSHYMNILVKLIAFDLIENSVNITLDASGRTESNHPIPLAYNVNLNNLEGSLAIPLPETLPSGYYLLEIEQGKSLIPVIYDLQVINSGSNQKESSNQNTSWGFIGIVVSTIFIYYRRKRKKE
ncbi:MAG: hypothetical protein ACXAC7_07580 [Candidatus Hodarchaeales archaeon]|jgi:hypothetical protein